MSTRPSCVASAAYVAVFLHGENKMVAGSCLIDNGPSGEERDTAEFILVTASCMFV